MNATKPGSSSEPKSAEVNSTTASQATDKQWNSKLYTPDKPVRKSRRLWWIASGGLFTLILIAVLLIAPIGKQSALAMGLDAMGQHKAAMTVDLLTRSSNNGAAQFLAGTDFTKPQACKETIQRNLQKSQFKLDALQGNSFTDIRPLNPEYSDKFNAQLVFQGLLDSRNLTAAVDLDASVKADSNVLNRIAKDNGSSTLGQDYGQVSGQFSGSARLTQDAAYFTISSLNLKTADFTSNSQLNNWYRSDFKSSDENREKQRQEGLRELTEALADLTNLKPGDMFSTSTIETFADTACDSQSEIEVLAPKEVTLGQGTKSQTKTLRPIKITPKTYSETELKNTAELSAKLQSDEQLKSYLKGKYATVAKVGGALNKILPEREEVDQTEYKRQQDEYQKALDKLENDLTSGNYDSSSKLPEYPSYSDMPKKKVPAIQVPTQEEYNKQIEEAFKNPKSADEIRKQMQDSLQKQQELFEIKSEPVMYYLDLQSGNLAGYETSQTVFFKDKALDQNKSQLLKDILKDGVNIRTQAWNIKINQVDQVQIPTESKDVKDFQKDFEKTDAGNRLNEIQKSSNSETSPLASMI